MWFFRARVHYLLEKFPARRNLRELQKNYWALYDEWELLDSKYRHLHAKHIDLNDELRYWESRHSKVLNYIEKQMEMDTGGK